MTIQRHPALRLHIVAPPTNCYTRSGMCPPHTHCYTSSGMCPPPTHRYTTTGMCYKSSHCQQEESTMVRPCGESTNSWLQQLNGGLQCFLFPHSLVCMYSCIHAYLKHSGFKCKGIFWNGCRCMFTVFLHCSHLSQYTLIMLMCVQ